VAPHLPNPERRVSEARSRHPYERPFLITVGIDIGAAGISRFQSRPPGTNGTVADVGRFTGHTIRVVGTPEQIADRLMQWRAAGIGGINVMNATIPGSYVEFIDYVMPVLQDRRLAQREYAKGSIRRKLTGADYLPDRHPAAAYRGAFAPTPLPDQ
jgi:alkanesulfonate monooxygenase SsuD/methylene tetrahydromethanopterin reductase-like flavin-dependent oxidoreductase (luciferase family)